MSNLMRKDSHQIPGAYGLALRIAIPKCQRGINLYAGISQTATHAKLPERNGDSGIAVYSYERKRCFLGPKGERLRNSIAESTNGESL